MVMIRSPKGEAAKIFKMVMESVGNDYTLPKSESLSLETDIKQESWGKKKGSAPKPEYQGRMVW